MPTKFPPIPSDTLSIHTPYPLAICLHASGGAWTRGYNPTPRGGLRLFNSRMRAGLSLSCRRRTAAWNNGAQRRGEARDDDVCDGRLLSEPCASTTLSHTRTHARAIRKIEKYDCQVYIIRGESLRFKGCSARRERGFVVFFSRVEL